MSTVYITVGIPASGKSTWAREMAPAMGAVIVCRDDIRIMQGLKHGDDEQRVTKVHRALIEGALLEGMDVIVADTNIVPKFRKQLIKFAHEHGADVVIKTFPIDVDEAILRDYNRDRAVQVGPQVIMRMHQQLEQNPVSDETIPVNSYAEYEPKSNYPAIVVDIDGTLAHMKNRSPYDESRVGEDEFDHIVSETILGLVNRTGAEVIVVSGRTDKCRKETEAWLDGNGFPFDHLFMRKSGDQRPDWIVKNEIYDASIIPYNDIIAVFDDRDQVVRHLRKRGIKVFQVAAGRF